MGCAVRPGDIRALLAEVAARGIELSVHGSEIRYRPTEAMTPNLAQRLQENRCAVITQLQAMFDPFTSRVLGLFGGEVVPDGAGPRWEDCVPLSQVLDELLPLLEARVEREP